MYGSNNMKKSVVFNNQFTPKLGGQFELESGGQFAPELVVNLHWKVVVNLTGFSSLAICATDIFRSHRFGLCKFEVVRRTGKSLVAKKAEAVNKILSAFFQDFLVVFLKIPPRH